MDIPNLLRSVTFLNMDVLIKTKTRKAKIKEISWNTKIQNRVIHNVFVKNRQNAQSALALFDTVGIME